MYSLWGWLAVVIVTAVIAGGVASILARQRSRLLQQELAQHAQVRADLIERLQAQERLTHQWQTDYSKLQAEYAAVRAELSAKLESAAEKQQLDAFKQQVTQQYTEELKQRSELSAQVNSLRELNQQMAAEAEALTRALKGDTKTQGAWGEVVLERILKQSGLREGHEYHTQAHHKDTEGRTFKPDVIVHLPNNKDVVIDS